MRKLLVPIALVAVLAGGAMAAAAAGDLSRYRISWSTKAGNRLTGTSVSFYVPRAWRVLRAKDNRHLSFHEGRPACRYSVTFTTRQAADTAETPAEHVAAAVPAAGSRYVLDFGQRGTTAAWRVVRLPTTSLQQIRLRAMRADRRSIGNGAHKWQETVVTAASLKGGECHSGTYRQVLGPQIGNALATASGRAYDFTTRG